MAAFSKISNRPRSFSRNVATRPVAFSKCSSCSPLGAAGAAALAVGSLFRKLGIDRRLGEGEQPGSDSTWATGNTARAGYRTLSVPVPIIFPGPAAVVNVPSIGRRFDTSRAVAVIDTGMQAASAISLEERAGGHCAAKTAGRTFILFVSSAHAVESLQLRIRSISSLSQSAAPWSSRPHTAGTAGCRRCSRGILCRNRCRDGWYRSCWFACLRRLMPPVAA